MDNKSNYLFLIASFEFSIKRLFSLLTICRWQISFLLKINYKTSKFTYEKSIAKKNRISGLGTFLKSNLEHLIDLIIDNI